MDTPQSLLGELLAKPVGPATPARQTVPERDFTRQIEVSGDVAEVVIHAAEKAGEDAATAVLVEQDLDPAEWEAVGFKISEWTRPNGEPGTSTKFAFKRRGRMQDPGRVPLDDLLAAVHTYRPIGALPVGDYGYLVLIGDTQFGKVDGDGVEGTLQRTIDCIDQAAERLELFRALFSVGHVHLAFLGDHSEGFVSQGGANTWRTVLTQTEQIRLTRRMMAHAALTFAALAERVTAVSVPGNHDQAIRIAGKGVTRYDDSHDCESLIAVADAFKLRPDLAHVEFYVPDNDELTVTLDVAGTVITHAHGHQWRPGKHLDWWKGQAFNALSPMHQSRLLVAGHLHHLVVDTDGPRTFVQVPALESESTWFRHHTGTTGAPGIVVALTRSGETNLIEHIR